VILDEAQNTSPEQMKMFLTRLGFNSKMVVTGDITQIDLPHDKRSGLIVVREILDRVEAGEEVTISRHGKAVAIVLSPRNVRVRRASAAAAIERAEQLGRELEAARHEPLALSGTLSPELGELWIRELREERDAR